MELFKCLFLISIIKYASTELSHSDEHQDAFDSILETLKLNDTVRLLQRADVSNVLEMLGIQNCSNVKQHKVATIQRIRLVCTYWY